MGFFDYFTGKTDEGVLDEALKQFVKREPKVKKMTDWREKHGEGIEDFNSLDHAFGQMGMTDVAAFNGFHRRYIDQSYVSEFAKIDNYRTIARYPEIAEVIEDAVNESTQTGIDGSKVMLEILDDDLKSNENISKAIMEEFDKLFYKRLDISRKLDNLFQTYYTDGRVYIEHVIDANKPKNGITGIKKLPTETMSFAYNPLLSNVSFFVQYINGHEQAKLPETLEQAEADPSMIAFTPKQITYLDYGQYGPGGKKDVQGYLEKVKQPYNQVKLLETSIVIYRLVRAPERLVFTIDVGNMPQSKAYKFVNDLKNKMQKKVTYDPTSGNTTNEPNVVAMLENFFLPQSADGRGSSVDSIGGNPSGFSELDDLYYFQRKMYRALKYPMSRIDSVQEKQNRDVLFAGSGGEITRDETKWGRFLKTHQDKFCDAFLELFLLHLDFTGLATQYEIDRSKLQITMPVPNNYISQMQQTELEQRWQNFGNADNETFGTYWRMRNFLNMSDEEITDVAACKKKDVDLGFKSDDEGGGGSRW